MDFDHGVGKTEMLSTAFCRLRIKIQITQTPQKIILPKPPIRIAAYSYRQANVILTPSGLPSEPKGSECQTFFFTPKPLAAG